MSSLLEHCAVELVKIAAEDSQKKGYLRAMAATAPIAAMQSVADFPEGWAEKGVETRLKQRFGAPIEQGSSSLRRGVGRATGRMSAALVTTPLFLKGLRDIKEGRTRDEKLKGYAEVVGSGMGFAGLKGAIEAGVEHGGTGQGAKEVLKRIRALAGARTLIGAGSGVVTAATAAAMLKRQEKNKDSKVERYVVPTVLGATFGAGKGAIEHGFEHGTKSLATPALRGELKARMGGKVAGGLVAGLLANEIFRYAFDKEKKANLEEIRVAPQPSELYTQSREWATTAPITSVQSRMKAIPDPEATPARRAVYYGMYDALAARAASGEKNSDLARLPDLKRRDEVHPLMRPPTVMDTGLVAAAISAPAAAWNLGFAKLKPAERDRVLAENVDRMILAHGIDRIEAQKDFWGNPSTFFGTDLSGRPVISAAKDAMPEQLAHELGHATAGKLRRETIAHPAAREVARATGAAAVVLSLFAIESFNDKSFTTPAELETRAKFMQGLGTVAAALQAPQLAEEAVASARAVEILQRAGAPPREALFKSLRTLGPAFATYAAPAAAPFVAAAYLKRKAAKGRERGTMNTSG